MKKSVLIFLGIIAGLLPLAAQTGREDHTDVWFSGKVGVGVFSRPLKVWKQDDLVRMAETTNLQYQNGGAEGPYMGKVFRERTGYTPKDYRERYKHSVTRPE